MKRVLVLFLFFSILGFGQNQSKAEVELLELYNKAITNWKQSPAVQDLVKTNPELIPIVESISADNVNSNGNNIKMHFLSLFDGNLTDFQISSIRKFFEPENLNVIEGSYWKIIESTESKEIANLVLAYLEKVRGDLTNKIESFPKKN